VEQSGHVVKPSNGWYSKVDEDGVVEDNKYRLKETESKDFWMPILTNKTFYDYIKNKYSIGQGDMIKSDDLDSALEALEFDE